MKAKALIVTLILLPFMWAGARESTRTHDLEYRAPEGFKELIGAEIRNNQNERLGRIVAIDADLSNGRLVEFVIAGGGGFFGIGSKLTAVPPRALKFDAADRVVRLDVSREKFDAAPKYDPKLLQSSSKPEKVVEFYRYFGLKPWFFVAGETVYEDAEILELGYVQRTNRLVGLPIMNMDGDYLGRIEGLVMNLPLGRIAHVIAATDSDSTSRRMIQPRALTFNRAGTALMLDNNYVEMDGEPHFKWSSGRRNDFQQETYVNREVKAKTDSRSNRNSPGSSASFDSMMVQGETFRDVQKTARIRNAIASDSQLSGSAKGVEVVTLNAQTTLRGAVNTAAEKQKIGEIAKKAGRAENVSNLIEVRPRQ